MNLIGNASKFTPPDGHVWITLTVEGDEAVLRVRDDGIGIASHLQPRVFDLFTQVHGSGASPGGLGLGLALVQRLVRLHGGSVQVRSEGEGRGSEFIVRLPMPASD